jgi:hypothetical protein
MFEAYKAKKRAEKEAAQLAEITARDLAVGLPTPATMQERVAAAARAGMWDIVDDCVKKGAPIDTRLRLSRNDRSSDYLEAYHDLPSRVHDYGSSSMAPPLVVALLHKNAAVAARLVGQGADVNHPMAAAFVNVSPLEVAVCMGMTETVKLLCDNGADLAGDIVPLKTAESMNLLDIIKIIRAEEAKRLSGQAQIQLQPRPDTPEAREALEAVSNLPDASRDWVLRSLAGKFPAPVPVTALPEGLAQDVVVSKPLTLKKQS